MDQNKLPPHLVMSDEPIFTPLQQSLLRESVQQEPVTSHQNILLENDSDYAFLHRQFIKNASKHFQYLLQKRKDRQRHLLTVLTRVHRKSILRRLFYPIFTSIKKLIIKGV